MPCSAEFSMTLQTEVLSTETSDFLKLIFFLKLFNTMLCVQICQNNKRRYSGKNTASKQRPYKTPKEESEERRMHRETAHHNKKHKKIYTIYENIKPLFLPIFYFRLKTKHDANVTTTRGELNLEIPPWNGQKLKLLAA